MRQLLERASRRLFPPPSAQGGKPHKPDLEPQFMAIWERCKPFTMTSIERGYGLWLACNYIVKAGIPGEFIECGVWRGGSAMVMAHTLLQLGEARPIHLYDTFEGMVEPSEEDVTYTGEPASIRWSENRRGDFSDWCYADLNDVRQNMTSTGYPMELVNFVEGPVEQTLPRSSHGPIALLRLDTDWYESTAMELRVLYPLVTRGGVLIVDDYGHWRGSKKAVDEYFGGKVLLTPLDYTGRMSVKI